jgi:4-hydroxy-3-methylbut-2-en-1-yl diphosphate reductase
MTNITAFMPLAFLIFGLHGACEVKLSAQVLGADSLLPSGNITVGITAGASCPNNLTKDVICRLFELRGVSVQQVLGS